MRKRRRTTRLSLASTAHHEAGHFVVGKAVGRQPWHLTIVQNGDTLGRVDGEEDIYDYESPGVAVLNAARARACVVELYAGAAAQLRFGEHATLVQAGASRDDAEAARIIAFLVLPSRRAGEERRLRGRAARLVIKHWREIVAVANELLEHRSIDFVRAERAIDVVRGRNSPATLERYIEMNRQVRAESGSRR